MKKVLIPALCLCLLTGCHTPEPVIEPANDTEDTQYLWLNETLDAFLNDGDALPAHTPDGQNITWSVRNGAAEISDGVIHKNEDAQEYEPVELLAQVGDTYYSFDHLLLLDEYVAYVISYFTNETDENLKLAYTYDSVYWFRLNADQAVLSPSIGTKRFRDPSIVRRSDGTFTVIATQGYDTDSIYAYDSPDLITFENERLLQVNFSSDDLAMSGKQAWAPEGFYDRTLDKYCVYWSSVEDKGMYYNLTEDFTEMEAPQKFVDTGFEVIDGTLYKDGADYTIILKDERSPMEEYSQLFRGVSHNGWHDFGSFEEPFSGHQSEGPMIMKNLLGDGYYLFYDDYTRSQFRAYYTDEIQDGWLDEIWWEVLYVPLDKPAHSYALPVTWRELERLINHYGGY